MILFLYSMKAVSSTYFWRQIRRITSTQWRTWVTRSRRKPSKDQRFELYMISANRWSRTFLHHSYFFYQFWTFKFYCEAEKMVKNNYVTRLLFELSTSYNFQGCCIVFLHVPVYHLFCSALLHDWYFVSILLTTPLILFSPKTTVQGWYGTRLSLKQKVC